jgi:hypothetical protein
MRKSSRWLYDTFCTEKSRLVFRLKLASSDNAPAQFNAYVAGDFQHSVAETADLQIVAARPLRCVADAAAMRTGDLFVDNHTPFVIAHRRNVGSAPW